MQPSSQAGPATFFWTDAYLLGFHEMDEVHREFVGVVDAMLHCADAEFAGRIADFTQHAKAHFGTEDAWMTDTGFPARDCHIAEHAAVLKSAAEVSQRGIEGDVAIGRAFAAELARWFPGHADYLDSALAHWMVKRRHGGKPIVLRRNIGSGSSHEANP